jgi:hypothetical protein
VEGLLPPEHNNNLLTLLYRLAEWHALAKLRMHTDATLERLEKATVIIGKELREFRDKSAATYTCRELPSEKSRRARRQRKKKERLKKGPNLDFIPTSIPSGISPPLIPSSTEPQENPTPTPPANSGQADPSPTMPSAEFLPKVKNLNLSTYKLHALGDYVRTIRLFGTTDSYSTQIVSVLFF